MSARKWDSGPMRLGEHYKLEDYARAPIIGRLTSIRENPNKKGNLIYTFEASMGEEYELNDIDPTACRRFPDWSDHAAIMEPLSLIELEYERKKSLRIVEWLSKEIERYSEK